MNQKAIRDLEEFIGCDLSPRIRELDYHWRLMEQRGYHETARVLKEQWLLLKALKAEMVKGRWREHPETLAKVLAGAWNDGEPG